MNWKVPVAEPILTGQESRLVAQVMKEGRITQGRFVKEFEDRVAGMVGVPYAVATSSGTAAVHCALMALGIGPGDEVLTSPLSCIASANPILFQGAKPVFVDIDPFTYNMDLALTERLITRRTRAILAVHLFGLPIDMTALMRLARKYRLAVIEDGCQSFGALHRGRPVGGFGDVGCFSFYANKIITTGEGGMAVTRSAALNRRMRGIRNLGQDKSPFHHPWIGGNYKLSNLHAAIGIPQMKNVERFITRRRAIAAEFMHAFRAIPVILPSPQEFAGDRHVHFSYPIELKSPQIKRVLEKAFRKAGIETRPFLSVIPNEASYRRLGYSAKTVPAAMKAFSRGIYVSCSPALRPDQIRRIIQTVRRSLHGIR